MDSTRLGQAFEALRPELVSYLTRLVARPAVAEELAQAAALRALEVDGAPAEAAVLRPWFFAVATRLAADHLRRHGTWREAALLDVRHDAEADPTYLAEAGSLRGTPEASAVAREHLAACVACTLRTLPPEHAAALLLHQVHDLTVQEAGEALSARPAQVKGWIQAARAALRARYAATCALVRREGVCFQCVELDGFMNGTHRDPLAGTDGGVEARLAILRSLRVSPPGLWQRLLARALDRHGEPP
jgi:RNA polymerase sigma-70 factor, ECF subfamily